MCNLDLNIPSMFLATKMFLATCYEHKVKDPLHNAGVSLPSFLRYFPAMQALPHARGIPSTILFPEPAIPWGGSGTIRDRHTKNCMSPVLRMHWK